MKTNSFYLPDTDCKRGEKRCAICGKIDKRENLSFKITTNGPVEVIDGRFEHIPCWVCRKCAK